MRPAVALLVVSLVSAGCAGSEPTDPALAPTEPGATESAARGLVWADGDPVRETLHEEGTFAATDYCIGPNLPSCFLAGSSEEVAIDITDALPVGMPSRVTVVHEFDGGTVGLHDIGFSNGCGGYWFASEGRATAGPHVMGSERIVFDILMSPCFEDARTQVEVYPIISDPQPETPWTLDVTVTAEPARALPGLPVIVPLAGNVTALEASTDSGEGEFLLWDPDDSFLGRFQTGGGTVTLPANGTEGDHVLVVASDSPPLQLNLTGATEEQAFRGLGTFDWRPVGDRQLLDQPGPVTWEFEVGETALGVLLIVRPQGDPIDPPELHPGAYTGIDAQISSPSGPVLEAEFRCLACLPIFGGDARAQSEPGDPHMEPGAFTATVDHDGAVMEAQAYTFHYQR